MPESSRAASATWRSSSTRTCPTSRASGPTRSARSGCSTRWSAPTCRSSEVAGDVTLTVTPVLADQLEDAGRHGAPARRSCASTGSEPPSATRARCRAELRPAARGRGGALPAGARAARRSSAATRCAAFSRRRARARGRLCRLRRDPRRAAAARHRRGARACSSTPALRSHRRRFGWAGGFWLPECAYGPGLEPLLAERGVRWFCVDQSAHEPALGALAPVATEAGPVALPIDWEAVELALVAATAIPPTPPTPSFTGKSLRGDAALGGRRRRLRPEAAAAQAAPPGATSSSPRVAARLRGLSRRARPPRAARLRDRHRAARPLVVGGAAAGSRACSRGRRGARGPPRHAPRGARAPRAGGAAAARLDLGRGQGPAHLGLAGGRRPRLGARGGSSCACCGALGAGGLARRRRRSAPRASCSPLQASDWAFLDRAARRATTPSSAPPSHARGAARGHRLPAAAPTRACAPSPRT